MRGFDISMAMIKRNRLLGFGIFGPDVWKWGTAGSLGLSSKTYHETCCGRSAIYHLPHLGRQDTVQELRKKYPQGLPTLDPVEDMGVSGPQVREALEQIKQLEQMLQYNEVAQVIPPFRELRFWHTRGWRLSG